MSSSAGNDPLAELARLIGQTDPFGEFARAGGGRAAAPPPGTPPNFGPSDYFDSPPTSFEAPAAPPRRAQAAQPPHVAPPSPPRPPYGADHLASASAPPYPESEPSDIHADAYDPHSPSGEQLGEEEAGLYEDAPRPQRRMNIVAIAAVFVIAILGTAAAFGYRAMFGSHASQPPPVIKADTTPSKIVAPATAANKTAGKAIYDRVADHSQDEKVVPRDEKPVEVKSVEVKPSDFKNVAPVTTIVGPQAAAAPAAAPPAPGSGVISGSPRRIHTITIHPDQLGGATPPAAVAQPPVTPIPGPPAQVHAVPVAPMPPPPAQSAAAKPVAPPTRVANVAPAAVSPPPRVAEPHDAAPAHHTTASVPSNAPLSLSPNAPAARPMRTASVAPAAEKPATHAGGGYAVQVSSQRSEAEAEAAFRGLQAKYPNILGGRKPFIHKVDLGAKGTYYRTMIGPFASGSEAAELCNGLRAAGGQCLIQRN